uniref:Uncharacterized protein n=1 Tax=Anguilla anguilla TaxID=7936 RepID=A0A0E9VQX4_ANGAN
MRGVQGGLAAGIANVIWKYSLNH